MRRLPTFPIEFIMYSSSMKINPSIFKAYDIRGKYPAEINEEVAEKVGRATAIFISKKLRKRKTKIIVCSDVRLSSPILKDAVIKGIISQGSDVEDVGIGTTPYFYFLMRHLSPDGGLMVTASHNPAEYNGFKIRARGGVAVSSGSGLEEIKKIVISEMGLKSTRDTGFITSAGYFREEYIKFIIRGISIKKINAAIDASGGSTAYFLPRILEKFPEITYKPLFFEPDGSFSKHPPNPLLEKSQEFVKGELRSGKFKFGVIFDGDGDRAVFLDEKGNVLKSEYVFGLLAEEILQKNPGTWFVLPVNTSKGVRDYLKERGGKVKLSRIGYTFMQEAMKNTKAQMGVELSGHFYFKDFFSDDSALMAFLRFAAFLSRNPRPVSQLVKPFETYISSGELNFEVQDKKEVLNRIRKFYQSGKISVLDGITVEYKDWWFNVRPSNTESLIRLVLEAKTQEMFEDKLSEVRGLIH